MTILLEDNTPYEKSILWRLHHEYYQRIGTAAWERAEIPSDATSNRACARHNALFLLALAEAHRQAGEPAERPFVVLEIGAGSGRFARNLLAALAHDCGSAGRTLLSRLEYWLSDFSPKTLDQALQNDELAYWLERQVVRPTVFDMNSPLNLVLGDRSPGENQIMAVIANYACCVLPVMGLRVDQHGQWYHCHLKTTARDELGSKEHALENAIAEAEASGTLDKLRSEQSWPAVSLADLFAASPPWHIEHLQQLGRALGTATITYPYRCLELLEALNCRLTDHGLILVNDFGSTLLHELAGLKDLAPSVYGNSLSHPLNFALFEITSALTGVPIIRTKTPHSAVHSFAFGKGAGLELVAQAFRKAFVDQSDGEDLMDFGRVAFQLQQRGNQVAAARFFQRCHRLDPKDPQWHFQLGQCSLVSGYTRRAIEWLLRGLALDLHGRWDFEYLLGNAYQAQQDRLQARRWFEKALLKNERPEVLARLASIQQAETQFEAAYHTLNRAIKLAPTDGALKAQLEALKAGWWAYGLAKGFKLPVGDGHEE